MKKLFLFLIPVVFLTNMLQAQGRGIKIGYIDMEYILQNVPDYAQAKNELEQKAQKWKQEIETKKNDLTKLKDALKTERVLLTKELIEEREEEIAFQEKELIDYQQKRFGPTGDLITQKAVLVKPIQDQVFNAAQDIAEAKKYDFIFDKSSDLTILFAAKRYDISDQVVRTLTRSAKREQMSKKQLQAEEAKEAKENMVDENPGLAARQKILEEKKSERDKMADERKAAYEARRKAAEDKRLELVAQREAKKNGTAVPAKTETSKTAPDSTATAKTTKPITKEVPDARKSDSTATAAAEARKEAAAARAKVLEDRKKALEEKRQKAIEAREAAKKAKEEERLKAKTPKDSITN
jgi:Skp family chaperone for outer membrane proteins